ncbi:hypothetical protein DPV78_012531 [Talaromyces pinophilus]|nr:hypothetical protein DPV78_012531 [Talaromyces pinophilus]
MPLETYFHISSEKGLSSVTSLIIGSKEAILFDPPFLIPDANDTVIWIKQKLEAGNQTLKAIFVTHHHPDHFFSANPILEAFPEARFFAAPYVLAGINKEYDDKVVYWPSIFGRENIPEKPRKPDPFEYTFFVLDGNPESPVHLLGPVQGDSVDHTIFWLPKERTLICGDSVYARSTHVWVEEVESPALLEAWQKTIQLIEHLNPLRLIPGHIERGWEPDVAADLAHMKKYLSLFGEKVTFASQKATVDELYEFFKNNFPQANKNLDFFLGHLSNQFGEGGKVWEENRHQGAGERKKESLQGYWFS